MKKKARKKKILESITKRAEIIMHVKINKQGQKHKKAREA